jgi:hypothetical protein
MTGQLPNHQPWLSGAPTWDGRWHQLAAEAYVGARDGDLSPDVAFDLASFLLEWAAPTPAFSELADAALDRAAQPDDTRHLAELARQALRAVGYAPDFRLAPELLSAIAEPVEHLTADLRATGLTGQVHLRLPDDDPRPTSVWFGYEHSAAHTSGLTSFDALYQTPADLLTMVAGEVQDAVMHSVWGAWPVCPAHYRGVHPALTDSAAAWQCSAGGGHVISPIGQWARPR